MKYYVYGINSYGSKWYLGKTATDSARLYPGAPKEMRKVFSSKAEAQQVVEHLDYCFRFGSTRHYIEPAIKMVPIGVDGFSCSCCARDLSPTDEVAVCADCARQAAYIARQQVNPRLCGAVFCFTCADELITHTCE